MLRGCPGTRIEVDRPSLRRCLRHRLAPSSHLDALRLEPKFCGRACAAGSRFESRAETSDVLGASRAEKERKDDQGAIAHRHGPESSPKSPARRLPFDPRVSSGDIPERWPKRPSGSYASSSQYSTAGPGLANMMSSSLASFARIFPVSRYSMTSPGVIEESMRTRIGESVRLMI